ncbi:MAG TPA: HAMP domain-containing sensor histidine kinase [Candidatus Nitrosotenuis sp.]
MAAINPAINFGQSLSEKTLLDKIKRLESEKQRLWEKNTLQQKTLITLERKLAKFDEIKEQRDWLLDEMTKKIGELNRFQSEFFKAEKFTVIGEMAARLAHDMRNPLAIIKNTVELVKLKHSSKIPAELLHLFVSIDNASSRLVFQLDEVLNFVRRSPLEYDEYSLHDILESAMNKIIIPDEIRIHKPANNVCLFCDRQKIEAVFTNLLMNAIQAMENSGDVIIRFSEGDEVVVFTVQDSGPGIPANMIDKIFEPLFTTTSRGTGLGLPAVKTIIQQHQGTINVTNGPTVFSVSLPKGPL